MLLQDIKARWDRVDASIEQLLDNQQRLTDVAQRHRHDRAGQQAARRACRSGRAAGRERARGRVREPARALAQRIAKNAARARVVRRESIRSSRRCSRKDAGAFREAQSGLARGGDAPPRARRPRRARTTRASSPSSSRSAPPPSMPGVAAVAAEHGPARLREAGGARVNNDAEGAARGHDEARRPLRGQRQVARPDVVRDHLRAARARHAAAARQGVPRRRARARVRERAREQAQPGGDPPAAERDGQPRRRRSHGAGVGDRGRHRRHRGLDQFHDRGVAHAGQGHQFGDRPGDEGDAGRAGDLQPAVRGVAAPEPRDPAGVRVGAADGAVDQRGVAVGRAVGARWRSSRSPPPRRARSRCRTRSPA